MILTTERLILRPWKETDAEELYRYARDPRVGPIACWESHTSPENSRQIIREVLSAPGVFAVVLRETGLPVGSVGLTRVSSVEGVLPETEADIGFWIGVPYWGRGLIPEAVREIIRYAFEEQGLERLWCSYFEGNKRSARVQEKCGFRYHHSVSGVPSVPKELLRTLHVNCQTREEWLRRNEPGEYTPGGNRIETLRKEAFTVIGKEGSTEDGPGFVRRLWKLAEGSFPEIAPLVKKSPGGGPAGFWGAMTDFSRAFRPWENFERGLYLAGAECLDGAEAPEGWTKWVIPAFEYLRVENAGPDAFGDMILYLTRKHRGLAGAVQEFTCPKTKKEYLYFPVKRL